MRDRLRHAVNDETGEISQGVTEEEVKSLRNWEGNLSTKPDLKSVKPISTVVGARPPLFNLRDNPDFADRAFTIVGVREATGEISGKKTYYLYLAGWLAKSEKPDDGAQACIIRTGSEFVIGRVQPCITTINAGAPLFGILRHEGDAWLFD